MISYLLHSTTCMALILLFYHAILTRVKIYRINRCYLLGGLLFSLTVPFMPVGIADSLLNLGSNSELPIQLLIVDQSAVQTPQSSTSNLEWTYLLTFCLYSLISLFLAIRMIRNLYRMQLRSRKYPSITLDGYKVVLVEDDVTPHTFWDKIFVNRKQYEHGKIQDNVLIHELTHARQYHTLDILVVELLKIIFWINPVLYFYKRAIQLNHELIADEQVLSEGVDIADYQTLLLRMQSRKCSHYLSTSLNFKLTKKRFKMMTQQQSNVPSYLTATAIIPFILMLALTFGCKPTGEAGQMGKQTGKKITLELVDAETIKLNGESIPTSKLESRLSDRSMDSKKTTIHLKVPKNISRNTVNKVQKIIRDQEVKKIMYSTVKSTNSQNKNL